jgi:hypothetical protein
MPVKMAEGLAARPLAAGHKPRSEAGRPSERQEAPSAQAAEKRLLRHFQGGFSRFSPA